MWTVAGNIWQHGFVECFVYIKKLESTWERTWESTWENHGQPWVNMEDYGKYLGKGWGRKTMENHESWTNTLGLKPSRFVWFTVSFVKMVIQWANTRTLWTPNALSACSSWASTSSPSPSPSPSSGFLRPPSFHHMPCTRNSWKSRCAWHFSASSLAAAPRRRAMMQLFPWRLGQRQKMMGVAKNDINPSIVWRCYSKYLYLYIISTNKLMDYWCHFNVTQYQ